MLTLKLKKLRLVNNIFNNSKNYIKNKIYFNPILYLKVKKIKLKYMDMELFLI